MEQSAEECVYIVKGGSKVFRDKHPPNHRGINQSTGFSPQSPSDKTQSRHILNAAHLQLYCWWEWSRRWDHGWPLWWGYPDSARCRPDGLYTSQVFVGRCQENISLVYEWQWGTVLGDLSPEWIAASSSSPLLQLIHHHPRDTGRTSGQTRPEIKYTR